MKYKIVADSSCELNTELKEKLNIELVPLKINIDENTYIDNEKLDIRDLINSMKNSKSPIKTASPSPMDFIKEYEKSDNIFVVTLSSDLSSTYNNAVLAKNMILEKEEGKFIHVFDSLSASVGETLVSLKIFEFIQRNYNRHEIVNKVEEYISNMKTFFILESLDNLINAGRINKILGRIASVLSIKLIMGDDGKGSIKLIEKTRGRKKAFNRLVEIIGEQSEEIENKIIGIAHCNAYERAKELKKKIEEKYKFKDIIIVETGGLSTAYADDGGIIVAF